MYIHTIAKEYATAVITAEFLGTSVDFIARVFTPYSDGIVLKSSRLTPDFVEAVKLQVRVSSEAAEPKDRCFHYPII